LPESAEVGRLAVLSHAREVWCASNPFDRPGGNEQWRIELGVAFAAEGRGEVVLDDRPWTRTESRRIETLLASRGRTAHSRLHSTESTHIPPSPAKVSPPSTATSSKPAFPGKKRRPRRVIDLDDTGDPSDGEPSAVIGGSLRLPNQQR